MLKPETRRHFAGWIGYTFASFAVVILGGLLLAVLLHGEPKEASGQIIALLRIATTALCAIAALLFYREARP